MHRAQALFEAVVDDSMSMQAKWWLVQMLWSRQQEELHPVLPNRSTDVAGGSRSRAALKSWLHAPVAGARGAVHHTWKFGCRTGTGRDRHRAAAGATSCCTSVRTSWGITRTDTAARPCEHAGDDSALACKRLSSCRYCTDSAARSVEVVQPRLLGSRIGCHRTAYL